MGGTPTVGCFVHDVGHQGNKDDARAIGETCRGSRDFSACYRRTERCRQQREMTIHLVKLSTGSPGFPFIPDPPNVSAKPQKRDKKLSKRFARPSVEKSATDLGTPAANRAAQLTPKEDAMPNTIHAAVDHPRHRLKSTRGETRSRAPRPSRPPPPPAASPGGKGKQQIGHSVSFGRVVPTRHGGRRRRSSSPRAGSSPPGPGRSTRWRPPAGEGRPDRGSGSRRTTTGQCCRGCTLTHFCTVWCARQAHPARCTQFVLCAPCAPCTRCHVRAHCVHRVHVFTVYKYTCRNIHCTWPAPKCRRISPYFPCSLYRVEKASE